MDKLKERVKIKNIWTKNRIAVPPMVCFHWSDDSGCVTDKNLQHYRDMAAGGAGLIIAEATAVTKRGRLHETQLGLWEDEQTEGWKRLADAVHQYDVPFLCSYITQACRESRKMPTAPAITVSGTAMGSCGQEAARCLRSVCGK